MENNIIIINKKEDTRKKVFGFLCLVPSLAYRSSLPPKKGTIKCMSEKIHWSKEAAKRRLKERRIRSNNFIS